MFNQSGYQALPLGDFDRIQQSSNWLNGPPRGFFSRTQDQVQRGTDSPQGCLSWICHRMVTALVFLLTILTFPISGWFVLKVVPMYERMIVFRLGRIRPPQGPGVVLLLPFIDHWHRVDLRTRAFSIPPCKLTTRDGVLVSVGADVQFRVWDPVLSAMEVKDLNVATRMTAQNAMTKILLKKYLREIQMEKLRIGDQLLLEINDVTKSWGLEVDRVELILEAVLQTPQETSTGPLTSVPPMPGMEGLDSTIQQLALHFFGRNLAAAAATNPHEGLQSEHVEIQNEVEQPTPAIDYGMSSSHEKKFNTEELLLAVGKSLSESLVNQVRASYQINILLPSGAQSTYFIDLSAGQGRIGRGLPDRSPDVVLEMAESDLEAFIQGELHPLSAYVCGRLQVQGDLDVALKLGEVLKVMKQQR
ncbi:stomatin-like protein 1 isoform X2 [Hemicordylus capensis]|uniref:stomatin-like protein 1 isoform X2 n=1 Tax=Hemicordylus capensis TaxID=884348 RepID=UPI0023028FCA|nr:stomatin-like protein 1 isoform X2 [Hemicordylus capensis]